MAAHPCAALAYGVYGRALVMGFEPPTDVVVRQTRAAGLNAVARSAQAAPQGRRAQARRNPSGRAILRMNGRQGTLPGRNFGTV